MIKAKEYGVEDSNVEGLGGDEDRALKKKAAQTEPAWRDWEKYQSGWFLSSPKAKKDSKGKPHHVMIWRIEQFKVRAWPEDQYGAFYSGDSYIILHTFKEADSDKVCFDLHFWLGEETTQDEMGTAAYKTVELDTLLDDVPIQRRETQGNESQLFLSIFTEILKCGGVRYMEGGAESGFRHVKPEEYKPRLLHIKGKKKVRVKQVPLEYASLNSGDVFVLDLGMKIISWQGSKAGMFERNKCRELCDAIDTERRGKAEIVTVREDDGPDDDDAKEFYDQLSGSIDDIKSAEEGGQDDAPQGEACKILYRVSDASGSVKFTKEAEGGDVTRSKLDSNDAFILDAGFSIYVWCGKNATRQEKDSAMEVAAKYIKEHNKPEGLPIIRFFEGGERQELWAAFEN